MRRSFPWLLALLVLCASSGWALGHAPVQSGPAGPALLAFQVSQPDAQPAQPQPTPNQASPVQPPQPTASDAQPPKDVNVDINVENRAGRWYASPVWIAIGVLAVVVLVLLVAMAVRSGGGGGTTIVRD